MDSEDIQNALANVENIATPITPPVDLKTLATYLPDLNNWENLTINL
jgi:hypothetical protein